MPAGLVFCVAAMLLAQSPNPYAALFTAGEHEKGTPDEELSFAALACNADDLRELLRSGVSPNVEDADSGATALDAAIMAACDEAIDALLAAGADRWHRNKDGMDALDIAFGMDSLALPRVAGWYAQALLDDDPAGAPAARRHGITMLMAKAWAGDVEGVRGIVDAVGARPEPGKIDVEKSFELDAMLKATDNTGWTALHWACAGQNDRPDLVGILGDLANRQDHDGRTPLMLAAEMGHERMVGALVQRGADAAASRGVSGGRVTALDGAARQGYAGIVRILIDAMESQSREWLDQAAHVAARRGNTDATVEFLKAGVSLDKHGPADEPLLFDAILHGDAKLVHEMLARGAGFADNPDYAFDNAAKLDDRGIFDALLDAVATPAFERERQPDLQAALNSATYHGRVELVRACLAAGADPNLASNGEFPISKAVYSGDVKVFDALIKAGANPSLVTSSSRPLLVYASSSAVPNAMLDRVLHSGADANESTLNAAIHEAISSGNADAIPTLAAAGADMNARNSRGDTLLAASLRAPNPAVVRALIESGADPTLKSYGKTPLEQARFVYDYTPSDDLKEIIKLLEAHTPATPPDSPP